MAFGTVVFLQGRVVSPTPNPHIGGPFLPSSSALTTPSTGVDYPVSREVIILTCVYMLILIFVTAYAVIKSLRRGSCVKVILATAYSSGPKIASTVFAVAISMKSVTAYTVTN